MACREYTLPRDENLSEPEGWIRGNTKIGPVLEVTTCCLQGKYGVEIRIESMNKDHSHSSVRISYGLNKLVTNLSNKEHDEDNEQETSEMQFEDYALKSKNLCTLKIGLTTSGRASWQKEEETRHDFSIVLIRQDKKFFISELFKVIQDAISLILNCRTVY